MTNVDCSSPFIVLRPSASATDAADANDVDPLDVAYLKVREQAERTAAKTAGSTAGRRAHQELAQAYALLARQSQPASPPAGVKDTR